MVRCHVASCHEARGLRGLPFRNDGLTASTAYSCSHSSIGLVEVAAHAEGHLLQLLSSICPCIGTDCGSSSSDLWRRMSLRQYQTTSCDASREHLTDGVSCKRIKYCSSITAIGILAVKSETGPAIVEDSYARGVLPAHFHHDRANTPQIASFVFLACPYHKCLSTLRQVLPVLRQPQPTVLKVTSTGDVPLKMDELAFSLLPSTARFTSKQSTLPSFHGGGGGGGNELACDFDDFY